MIMSCMMNTLGSITGKYHAKHHDIFHDHELHDEHTWFNHRETSCQTVPTDDPILTVYGMSLVNLVGLNTVFAFPTS